MVSVGGPFPFSLENVADIVVTRLLPAQVLAPLEALGSVWVWKEADEPIPPEVFAEQAAKARGVLTMLTDTVDVGLLDAADCLEVVSQMAVGVDNIDVAACRERGVRVGHTPGVLTETVADTVFALLASVVRRIPEGERAVREGRWGTWSPFWLAGGDLHGGTVGVVGMGRVGLAVARRTAGFGMDILYASPREVPESGGHKVTLDELLARSDFVVLCARLTDETRGMIGRPQLEAMQETAYLVNVARGPIVVTHDLVAALEEKRIAGAALDVTEPEPLPPDHPLLGLDSCLVTPHIASASVATRTAMAELAVNNLVGGLRGEPMPAEFADGD
jgi:glyoxylate reductase